MINLLPEQEKARIKQEYKLRRLTVGFVLLLIAVVFADILFVPSYILVYYRLKSVLAAEKIKPTPDETTARATLTGQIQLSTKITTALKPDTKTYVQATDVISTLLKDKTDSNIVTSITFVPSDTTYEVSVQGVAKNRDSLQAFVSALRNEPLITKVDLPISNFAQDTSISFSFTISGKISS